MGLSSFCWLALKVNEVICASVFAIESNSESGLSVEDFCVLCRTVASLYSILSSLVQNVCECFSIASDRGSCCSVKAPWSMAVLWLLLI